MVMPSDPATHLVVVEPGLAVAGLEHLLDPMRLPLRTDDLRQRDLGARVGHRVVGPRLAHRTDHDQSLLRADPAVLLGPDSYHHRIDQERPLLARADLYPLPPRSRLVSRPGVGPLERHLEAGNGEA